MGVAHETLGEKVEDTRLWKLESIFFGRLIGIILRPS